MKSMTKYQLEHFKNKVNRQFQPYIEEQELIVKQFRTEAIDHAVKGLAKKMGADKVLDRLKKAKKQCLNYLKPFIKDAEKILWDYFKI